MKLQNLSAFALLAAGLLIGNSASAQWTKVGTKTYLTNAGDSIGIGTTNPAYKVDIQSSGIATMSLKSTTSNANILFDRKAATNNATMTYRTNGVNNWQTGTIGSNNYVLKNNSLNTVAVYCDYLTNNVGIGSAAPTNKLSVTGNANFTGNVGIGTTTPSNKLTVQTTSGSYGMVHTDGTTTVGTYIGSGNDIGGWLGTYSNHPLYFFTNNGSASMSVVTNGNVGIGTTNPTTKLDVNGNTQVRGSFTVGDATTNAQQLLFLNGAGYSEIQTIKQGVGFNNTILASPAASKVGIGSTTPSNKLSVNGNADFTGNVGFGAAAPVAKLDIFGALVLNGSQTTHTHQGAWLEWNKDGGGGRTYLLNQKGVGGGGFVFGEVDNANAITERMTINTIGQVAIGSVAPATGYQLTVGGSIICTSLKVQLQPFPDYVFAADYKLKSLSEVEDHIKTYSRLPGMPSACEIEDNGMDVGAIQGKVVEKVEELTLYIIQQQKQIDELKALLTSQKK